jgi:hypothetical protein
MLIVMANMVKYRMLAGKIFHASLSNGVCDGTHGDISFRLFLPLRSGSQPTYTRTPESDRTHGHGRPECTLCTVSCPEGGSHSPNLKVHARRRRPVATVEIRLRQSWRVPLAASPRRAKFQTHQRLLGRAGAAIGSVRQGGGGGGGTSGWRWRGAAPWRRVRAAARFAHPCPFPLII